jgi:hypothetical protein
MSNLLFDVRPTIKHAKSATKHARLMNWLTWKANGMEMHVPADVGSIGNDNLVLIEGAEYVVIPFRTRP